MKILLFATLITIIFTGCMYTDTYKICKKEDYKGFVVFTITPHPAIHCSNGELIINNTHYATKDGNYPVGTYYEYIPFNKETK